MIQFGASWALVLTLTVPLVGWVALRTRSNLSGRHLSVVTVLRCAAIALLALAAARPVWNGASNEISVAYALDVSRSVSPAFVTEAIEWIERAQAQAAPAHSRIVAFADRPAVLASTEELRSLEVAESITASARLARDATNLERALDESLLALDRDRVKRLVVLSDGNQTHGDAWRVLARLKAAGVRVYAIPGRVRANTDAWAQAIEAPDPLRDGEPVQIIVRVVSLGETAARVTLLRGKRPLGTREVRLQPGSNAIRFATRLRGSGLTTLSAQIFARGDTLAENDRIERAVWVGERSRVLYVEGSAESAGYLATALRAEGIRVDTVSASAMPADVAGLSVYDAVILSDAPARGLSGQVMRALESYVRDFGGGFLFAGGENTFGEEGYSGSPVERILPVEFKSQEKRKDLALVIAIDRSYSMKGRKMEYAKEAARAALDLLEEQHRFAVVAFDSQPYISVPLQQVRSKRRAEDQISRIQASGQTNIYPALGVVYRLLQQADVKTKHVLLLSDGDTHPADFERLLERMRNAKIVVSTVTIGEGGDPQLMENIARWGAGRNYVAASVESIPQIFVEETQKAVHENLVEEAVLPVVKWRMAALSGIDFATAPALKGFIATKPRETAEVAIATEQGAPLLVRWQYGLGKSVIFCSDVKNRWAADWLPWQGYGKFWAQLVRDTMRRDSGESVQLRVGREGADALIRLSILDDAGRFNNGLAPQVRVSHGNRNEELIALTQAGPGHYVARVPAGEGERLAVALAAGGGISAQSAFRAGVRMLAADFADELRSQPPNLALLEAIAAQTGGKMTARIEEVFDPRGDSGRKSRVLWPWLATLALALYLADIFTRRAPIAWRWLGS
ncbi:MAG: VWA domain-containing protein [Burkholderiales bacterium]